MLTKCHFNHVSLNRFAREEHGVVAIVVALCLTLLLGFVALAIDVGMLYRERAQLQASADIAALSVVPDFNAAQDRLNRSLERNAQAPDRLDSFQLGRFLRNPALPREQRFIALPNESPGINAVVINLTANAPLHFAQLFAGEKTTQINASSTALRTGAASFSLGSHLLRLNEVSLSEALSQSLNAQISLSAGDLAVMNSTVFNAGDFIEALRDQIGFEALNPAEILDQTIAPTDVIAALQQVTPNAVPSDLSGLLPDDSQPDLRVRDLISGPETELGLTVIDFLSDMTLNVSRVLAALAKPGATKSAVTLDVSASAPGVLDVETRMSFAQPPAHSGVVAMGEVDVTLHSAAARLHTDVSLSADLLGSLGAGVRATRLHLPLYTELAGASATLTELSCTGADPSAMAATFITAQTELHPANGTSLAALYMGILPGDPMTSTASFDPSKLGFADILDISITIDVPLLPDIELPNITLQARSHVSVGQSQTEEITFTKEDISLARMTKTFGSGALLETAVRNLLSADNLELRTKPGQSGLSDTVVASVLANVLEALPAALLGNLLTPIDGVLDSMLQSLGVELGLGELTLEDHLCEVPQLVR